uniref:histidine kinase n=1 Tax=Chlorobium chlorochromatii (strain CaD3) TaxID=340177 RepID=Q3ASH0_CHLCH
MKSRVPKGLPVPQVSTNQPLPVVPVAVLPGIYFVQSFAGKVLMGNERFSQCVAHSQHDKLLGVTAYNLIHTRDHPILQDALEKVTLYEQSVSIEVRLNFLTSENAFWYLFTVSPLTLNGVACFQFVGIDITERLYSNRLKHFIESISTVNKTISDEVLIQQLLDVAELLTGSSCSYCYQCETLEKNQLILSASTQQFIQEHEISLLSWQTNNEGILEYCPSATVADQLSDVLLLNTTFHRRLLFPINDSAPTTAFVCVGNKLCSYTEDDRNYLDQLVECLWSFFAQRNKEQTQTHVKALLERTVQQTTLCRITDMVGEEIAHLLISLRSLIQNSSQEQGLEASLHASAAQAIDAVKGLTTFQQDLFSLIHINAEHLMTVDAYDTLDALAGIVQNELDCIIEVESDFKHFSPLIQIDPLHLKRVITILCENALEAMLFSKTITIRLSPDVTFEQESLQPLQPMLSIAVHDTGVGIAPHIIPHMFEPFFTTHGEEGKRGIGLTIAKRLMHLHNGDIVCSSSEEGETIITLTLPMLYEKELLEHSTKMDSLVLMVISDVSVLAMLSLLLETHGYGLLIANSVEDALEFAETYSNSINMLVTETHLPECSGSELAALLLANQPFMKVLYLAASTPTIQTDKNNGMIMYPPFSGYDVLDMLEALSS